MKDQPIYSIHIEKIFPTEIVNIFQYFHDSTFLKLTGADVIENDFQKGGSYCLTFTNRGIISGKYIDITNSSIVLNWNVKGFTRPEENNTLLEITLTTDKDNCKFTLRHTNIINQDAAEAKEKSWNDILNEFGKILLI